MPGIMKLNADDAVYLTTNVYANAPWAWLETALAEVPPPASGSAKWCGPAAARYCDKKSAEAYFDCSRTDCESICAGMPRSPLCSGCLDERVRCRERVLARFADCATCPSGTSCGWDVGATSSLAGYQRCCPAGQVPCDGTCVSMACGDREEFSTETCRCECVPPLVRSAGGFCRCPPTTCPEDMPLLGIDCVCRPCPAPFKPCDGVCRNLDDDPRNCGNCNVVCALDQKCCAGQCTPVYVNGRCGNCRVDCASPFKCCPGPKGGHECADLRTDLENCGDCGNQCSDFLGMRCVGGSCICKPRYTPCGPDSCCGPGWTCFSGSPKGSQCTCPASRAECGPFHEECCAAGEVCCGNACTQLGTTADCGSCGDECAYVFYDAPGVVEYGSCDTQRHCRCPVGSVGVHRDPTGSEDVCCRASRPYLCADGLCHTMPC